jgi:hypothetical protein
MDDTDSDLTLDDLAVLIGLVKNDLADLERLGMDDLIQSKRALLAKLETKKREAWQRLTGARP